mgnify:CR=1 FL=1
MHDREYNEIHSCPEVKQLYRTQLTDSCCRCWATLETEGKEQSRQIAHRLLDIRDGESAAIQEMAEFIESIHSICENCLVNLGTQQGIGSREPSQNEDLTLALKANVELSAMISGYVEEVIKCVLHFLTTLHAAGKTLESPSVFHKNRVPSEHKQLPLIFYVLFLGNH